MVDRIHYEWHKGRTTSKVDPDDWSHNEGLLRIDLADEVRFVPFERLEWIRRENTNGEDA